MVFILFSRTFFLSLFSEILCNDKPYIISYNGKWYFPIFQFYSEKEFGGKYLTEADYLNPCGIHPTLLLVITGWFFHQFHIVPYIHTSTLPVFLLILPLPIIGWVRILLPEMCLPVVLYGFRICMLFSLVLAIIATLFGVLIGGVAGIFWRTDRSYRAETDRDLVVFTISLCGNFGGHDLFTQFYDSYPRPFPFSMDRIILLYEGRIS